MNIINSFEQLYRLSQFRLHNPEFTYRPQLNKPTWHDEGLNKLLQEKGHTIDSVSSFELGKMSNVVLDTISEKLINSSGVKKIDEYHDLRKENQGLLKIFYTYAFLELYLSVIEDQRRKIDRVLFKVLDKKNNKSSIQLYRDVMLMALYKETERILNSRKNFLEKTPDAKLKYILPKIPTTMDHYNFLYSLVRLEDFINYFLNRKNYNYNIYSVLTEDAFKNQGLLVSFLKPKVFIRKTSHVEMDVFASFKKAVKDLEGKLSRNGISYLHIDDAHVYFGDHHLRIYFEEMFQYGFTRNIKRKRISFKNLSSNLDNIMKAISNGSFKHMKIMI